MAKLSYLSLGFCLFLVFSPYYILSEAASNSDMPMSVGVEHTKKIDSSVINYIPVLSGVFEHGLRDKIIDKLSIFTQKNAPPSTIAQLKERVVNDLKAVDSLLRSLGYYDALADYEIDLKTNPITLNFMVRTGPKYKLIKFNLSSNSLDNQLFNALSIDPARFGMVPGTPATIENIKAGVRKLFEILGNNGYPYAKVLNEKITVDHDKKGIEVLLHMDPGKLVRFGETLIAPAEGVDEDFIKKRLQWKKGDVYSNIKVIQTIETLNNTQQYAFVKITRPNKQPTGSNLTMRVEAFPESSRAFVWKAGYDANNNFNVRLGWKGVNLFDDGSLIKVLGGFGQYYNGLGFEHIVPDAVWTESYLSTRFNINRTHTDSYSAMGAEISSILTTPIYDKLRTDVGLSVKFSSVKPKSSLLNDHNAPVISIPLAIHYEQLDDLMTPRKGWDAHFEVTPAMQVAPQRQFVQFKLRQSILRPLNDDHTLIMKAWYKLYASPSAGKKVLPLDWQFFAGGMGTVRGYGYQLAGKRDANGKPIGGRSLFAMGAEVNYFLNNDLALQGFFDAGSNYQGRYPNFSNALLMGVGGGVNYMSPIGDVQMVVGLPVRRRESDKRAQFYISLGQDF